MNDIITPQAHKNIITRGLPKTGQITSYELGDDGEHEAGWWVGRLNVNNRQRWIAETIAGDDIVIDRATGLMWAGDATAAGCNNGAVLGWTDALLSIVALNAGAGFAAFFDWRLPNLKELISIFNYIAPAPLIEEPPFENTFSADYWTSTTNVAPTNEAYHISFATAWVNSKPKDGGPFSYRIRCVRKGV